MEKVSAQSKPEKTKTDVGSSSSPSHVGKKTSRRDSSERRSQSGDRGKGERESSSSHVYFWYSLIVVFFFITLLFCVGQNQGKSELAPQMQRKPRGCWQSAGVWLESWKSWRRKNGKRRKKRGEFRSSSHQSRWQSWPGAPFSFIFLPCGRKRQKDIDVQVLLVCEEQILTRTDCVAFCLFGQLQNNVT